MNAPTMPDPDKRPPSSPAVAMSATWSEAQLREQLQHFRTTGDCQPCLDLLTKNGSLNRLLVLQDALRSAATQEDRDSLEDIAFLSSRADSGPKEQPPDTDRLQQRVRELYGEHAHRFMDAAEVSALAQGLWRLMDPPPSEECLLAIVGILIDRKVNDPVFVDRKPFNQSLSIYSNACEKCGGQKGGAGFITCPDCLERARLELEAGRQSGRFTLSQAAPDDKTAPGRMFLKQYARRYGCSKCNKQPIRPCECARELRVPANPRDGEVAKGVHLANGSDWFCVLRLKGN